MRLWSLHPSLLDVKGLVAVWREGLLAFQVISGKTKGYTKHPQLQRFQEQENPINAVTAYLHGIVDEAQVRGYSFNRNKLLRLKPVPLISVTVGQIEYERKHLLEKLFIRDRAQYEKVKNATTTEIHTLFSIVPGEVEEWERI